MTVERTILIPRSLTGLSAVAALKITELDLSSVDRCIFNFANTQFAEPLPMMVLANYLIELKQKFPDVKYICRSKETAFRGYADHIGFFHFLGFARGNKLGDASGSGNYVPIQLFDVNKYKEAAGEDPYAVIVSEKSSQLAEVLTQSSSGGLYVAVEYALREMIRNSFEHGMGSKVVVLGQHWPKKNVAEIVIFDNGIGIAETLKPQHDFDSSAQALELAVQPGITGTSAFERAHQDPYYRNSGFGLFVTSQFCARNGVFRIISGNSGLTMQKKNSSQHANWTFRGTCIQMKLRTDSLENSDSQLREIIDEGEKLTGNRSSASSASKQTAAWKH